MRFAVFATVSGSGDRFRRFRPSLPCSAPIHTDSRAVDGSLIGISRRSRRTGYQRQDSPFSRIQLLVSARLQFVAAAVVGT